MLAESFRVLRKGGAATFTIWGDKDKNIQFVTIPRIIDKYLTEEKRAKKSKIRTYFHLYVDEDHI